MGFAFVAAGPLVQKLVQGGRDIPVLSSFAGANLAADAVLRDRQSLARARSVSGLAAHTRRLRSFA